MFAGMLAALSPFTLGRIVLDWSGTEAAGTVIDKRQSLIWGNRYKGRSVINILEVRFQTADRRTLASNHSVSREAYGSVSVGSSVDVTYWPPVPGLNAIRPTPWTSPLFLFMLGLTLVLGWLCVMTVFRAFVPPPSESAGR